MCNSSENKLGEDLKEVVRIDVKQIAKCFSGHLETCSKGAVKCAIKHAIKLTIGEFQSLHQNQMDKDLLSKLRLNAVPKIHILN